MTARMMKEYVKLLFPLADRTRIGIFFQKIRLRGGTCLIFEREAGDLIDFKNYNSLFIKQRQVL